MLYDVIFDCRPSCNTLISAATLNYDVSGMNSKQSGQSDSGISFLTLLSRISGFQCSCLSWFRDRKECLDLQSELSENHNSEKLQWQKKEVELQNIVRFFF